MKRIFVIYILSTILIVLILGVAFFDRYLEFWDVFVINLGYILAFTMVVLFLLSRKNIRVRHLLFFSFVVPFTAGCIYVFSINQHTDLLFQYVPSDAPFYDQAGRQVSKDNVFMGINELMSETKYGLDDMGMIFYVANLYKIIDSPLFVKFVNLLVNLLNTFLIFKISHKFMLKRYAIFAALCFSISSFNIWFLISGLKEPVMLFFILVFFYFMLQFSLNNRKVFLFLMLCSGLMLGFFRIEVALFLFIAALGGMLFRNGLNLKKILVASVLFLSVLSVIFIFREPLKIVNFNRQNATVYKGEEQASKISLPIVVVSGVIGPLPTLIPHARKRLSDVSVFGASLILKMAISFFAIIGLFYVFRDSHHHLLPIVSFTLLETLGLIIIDSTFKLRYSLPHLPFMYILGFFGMYYLFEKGIKYKKLIIEVALGFQIGTIGLALLWNVLRM
ncbi:MAG: hypothetical protein R8G66_13030 [Cytophagales bacterium]|nr:hypothetical protein [Cytophagales bacterium]